MLVDIDDNDETEKIHITLNAENNSDSIPFVKSGWGSYEYKPQAQRHWDQLVRHAVAEVKSDGVPKSDMRPRFIDATSGVSILLDTGAQISLWPKHKFKDAIYDPSKKLQAVNGTRISTYGTRLVKIRHPKTKHCYVHPVILADLSEAILGFDFIINFKLDMRWYKGKCMLVDSFRQQTIPLKMSTVDRHSLDLALLTFKQYSQQQSEKQSKLTPDANNTTRVPAIIR